MPIQSTQWSIDLSSRNVYRLKYDIFDSMRRFYISRKSEIICRWICYYDNDGALKQRSCEKFTKPKLFYVRILLLFNISLVSSIDCFKHYLLLVFVAPFIPLSTKRAYKSEKRSH